MRRLWLGVAGVVVWAGLAGAEDVEVLVPEGEPVELLEGLKLEPMGGVRSVAFSPDGRTLATGTNDGTVRLWDVPSGRPLARLEGHTKSVPFVAFSPDGRTLASGAGDKTVRLWEVPSGRTLTTLEGHTSSVTSVAFSPDGRTLASGAGDKTVRLWEVPSGRTLTTFNGHTSIVTSVAFSPDGRTLASGAEDKTVRLWEVPSGRTLTTLEGHTHRVYSVAFSPDGRILASGAGDQTVRLWEVPSGRTLTTLKGHTKWVYSVAFSPDGRTLASGAWDKTVRLWEVPSGRPLTTLKGHTDWVYSVAFSPDGRTLTSGAWDQTVRLWEVPSGRPLTTLKGHTDGVTSVAFSPDGRTLTSGAWDQTVRLWEVPSGRPLTTLKGHTDRVDSVAFSPDGRILASGAGDQTVRLWEVPSGRPLTTLKGHTDRVDSVAFSPDGRILASGAWDQTVRLWGVPSGRTLTTLKGHTDGVTSVAFSPDGRTLASGAEDKTVRLWEVPSGRPLTTLQGHTDRVTSVAFSPDGRTLASGAGDQTVRLWEVPSGRLLTTLQGHTNWVYSVAFSPDGRSLASGAWDKTVRLWEVPSGRPLTTLQGHTHGVTSVAFSPDGRSLASSAGDGTLRLWDIPRRAPMARFFHGIGAAGQRFGQPLFYRQDDGRFLARPDRFGRLEPIRPPRPALPARLTVSLGETKPPGEGDIPGFVTLRVSNAVRAGRAHWLRVEGIDLPRGVVLGLPPVVQRLEPGASAELRIDVYSLSCVGTPKAPQPCPNGPAPRDGILRLELRDAFDERVAIDPVPLHLRAPQIELEAALVEGSGDSAAVTLRLLNRGDQDPRGLTVSAEFQRDGRRVEEAPVQQIPLLPQDYRQSLSFSIPAALRDRQPFTIELRVAGEIWPTHEWRLRSPSLRTSLVVILYLSVGVLALLLAAAIVLLRLYRDPAVLAVAKAPAALRGFGLSELPSVHQALRRVGRLLTALSAAQLPVARWSRALIAANGTPEERAQTLAQAIGAKLGSPIPDACVPAWRLQLPPLELRFGPDTVLVVCQGQSLESGDAQRLAAAISAQGQGPGVALALDLTDTQRASTVLADVPRVAFVTLSATAFRDLLFDDHPEKHLQAAIAAQRPVVELSPYQMGGGLDDDVLFFGREAELRLLADRRPRNVFVVGARQMGKSTLLKAVARRAQVRTDVEAFYLPLFGADVADAIARQLGAPRLDTPEAFYRLAAGTRERPRLWLLDEVDAFVTADGAAGHPLASAMRALAEAGLGYFVLAGYWTVYRSVALDPHSPLRNFGEMLKLGPLDREAAAALATRPMAALGLGYEDGAVDLILDATGCRANLVSIACSQLIRTLDARSRQFTRLQVEQVLRGEDSSPLRDELQYWRSDPLDRAHVHAALLHIDDQGAPLRDELMARLKAAGLQPDGRDLDASLERLELGYVLTRGEAGRLRIPVPLLASLVKEDGDLAEALADDVAEYHRGRAAGAAGG